ncbi:MULTISPECIES: undecaprenyl-diphosphatase [Burkholderiaceae]|uniref:Undecaprenyl-diphosphatase n=1 Tax=Pandoraea apista TaxID=93218 RepID=A0A5E5P6C7_9BURK|nr:MULTISPECIES: undecaprenyl-diphosphatase [Burkholderiaceae]MBR8052098.1 undecaprenyl-diphosphatase [Burkholderia vietnamiensis]VVG71904.1 undecaprenyl-diphosphatase [Pandoraea apista]HDR9283070.1 undecaprenyl-diphosphatase [Burkholderia vietnamiensis]
MESFNRAAFLWLNAPAHPGAGMLHLAVLLAQGLIWAIPAGIVLGWLCGGEKMRKTMLVATASGMLSLCISMAIGLAWPHPRPFMLGLGHRLIPHAADASFPSDHLTLWWAIAFSLWMQRGRLGAALTLLGIPVAWARIYLGVHFPLDMLGAAAVAGFSAWFTLRGSRWYLEPAYRLILGIHCSLFGRPLP